NGWGLLGLRFLGGWGVGGMWPNGVALVSECWPNASRPAVAGIMGSAINVGILCVSQLGRWHEVRPDSWRWLLKIGGAPIALSAIAFLFLPESPKWLAARLAGRNDKPKAPVRELFQQGLFRVTVVGILLGSIPLIAAWG